MDVGDYSLVVLTDVSILEINIFVVIGYEDEDVSEDKDNGQSSAEDIFSV